jgi:hypothetical protein
VKQRHGTTSFCDVYRLEAGGPGAAVDAKPKRSFHAKARERTQAEHQTKSAAFSRFTGPFVARP